MNDETEYQFCVNTGKEPFFYKGRILRESEDFLVIEDRKLGEVEVSKHAIISRQRIR